MMSFYVFLLLTVVSGSRCFDINDPETNLDFFVRTSGSKDPNVSTVVYFNGSVYDLHPGSNLQQIMYFEGYNINRKVWQPSENQYLSLSLEFVVYRDTVTMKILRVFLNPLTSQPNEVFFVANDPVNGHLKLGDIIPAQILPNNVLDFNLDIVLEYPNVLDPIFYQKYSAGRTYDAVELFSYFSNATTLSSVKDVSVGFIGTWIRKSQYLPWMEMGQTSGSLYFTTLVWSCPNGLDCIADDILNLVKKEYPEFLDAPKTYTEPDETSWTQFKKKIDNRRQQGLPDIILPTVPVYRNATAHKTIIDERVIPILNYDQTYIMSINGSAYSEILGQDPIKLFDFVSVLGYNVKLSSSHDLNIYYEGAWALVDPVTGKYLQKWNNPLTNKTVTFNDTYRPERGNITVPGNLIYTIDVPEKETLGLIIAHASTGNGNSDWSMTILNLIMTYDELKKSPKDCFIYGTIGMFGSWPSWMEMGNHPGNIVVKGTMNSFR